MNRLRRMWHVFLFIPLMLTAVIIICFVTFQMVWPIRSIHDVRMSVLDPVVRQGGRVRFLAHVCKEVEAASRLHFAMLNESTGVYLDAGSQYGNNRKGCFEVVQHFHVPFDAEPGRYAVDVLAEIPVNGLRTDTYRMPVGEVTVVK